MCLRAEFALSTVATLQRGVARNFYILRQEIGLAWDL